MVGDADGARVACSFLLIEHDAESLYLVCLESAEVLRESRRDFVYTATQCDVFSLRAASLRITPPWSAAPMAATFQLL